MPRDFLPDGGCALSGLQKCDPGRPDKRSAIGHNKKSVLQYGRHQQLGIRMMWIVEHAVG
ncbi:hypothetical protein B9081_017800 [Citrobacter werkmanii]|nr:hypothetical protein B9081_017800 [Citrobacter werkmanii]